MDMNYDESWCPVCDRQIMPKRFTVPVSQPEQPATPQVPPTSPSSPLDSNHSDDSSRHTRTKTGIARTRGGLLQGIGRAKPNGALKRSDSTTNKIHTSPPQQQQPPQTKPAPPMKVRTVIDQGPIPLYCSDDCRLEDLSRQNGAFPINYHPDCASPPLPPVPHNSFERRAPCDSEDESSSGSSLDSRFSSSSESIPVSPSIATLAAIYHFPPLPPAPPILPMADNISAAPEPKFRNDYQSGVMMAAKRIQAALCSDLPFKRSASGNDLHRSQQPIPGWTDGSDAWRESVYCFSPRSDTVAATGIETKPSFAASSSRGVQWTSSDLTTPGPSSSVPAPAASSQPLPRLSRSSQSYTDELYAKYSLPLSRRSESRTAVFPPSTSYFTQSLPPLSPTSTSSRRRRETPLVKARAEGRLLVPDVTPRAHSVSSQSPSPASLCSPLTRYPSEDSMWSEQRSGSEPLPPSSRPQAQVRSWSYDNMKTYPVMMLPPKKEKRIETRIVDGKAKEVEVEVEIVQPLKRLFLFHGKESSPERKW
ncbi:hypothetical protein PAXRUDRAFT_827273 [Paxillus rubicundulus Ve08.2h10]|uniref:Uncharacterized protein n=1 Tax=Paxillus rubicundulus Ve08.2h10 TaxID=930991 RepID=A0A0D0DQZ3_9AGAM|nr:hypothetical protein PAXRUDRAFT_827273 [Paxillus rubicundulus Ve08.2h10]